MRLSRTHSAILALIIANIIWGAAPPIFKWALQDIHPYTLAFLRFFIPAILMYPFVRNNIKILKKDYLYVFLAALSGITFNMIFFFQGLQQAPSINASLIISSAPIFIILYSLFFTKEKPSRKVLSGAFIGICGVLLVLVTPLFENGDIRTVGNIFFLFAMFCIVASIVLTRKIAKRNSPVAITFWSFLIGSLGLSPFFFREVSRFGFLTDISWQGIAGLAFGAILASLIAYLFQTYSLKYLTASDVSLFVYIDPVVTILVAFPLLGELPDSVFILGTILVLLGIFRAEGRFHWHPLHLFFKK